MTHPPIPHLATAPSARRAGRLAGWLLAICCLAVAAPIRAQSVADDASRRERIEIERRQADAVLEQRRWECSRRFVVTACIDKARATHRDAVESLNREEEAIDSRARQARAARRLEIIGEKTEAFAKLGPVPTPPTSTPSQPEVRTVPATTDSESSGLTARQKDQATADRAAARRAAASQLRREEAAREQAQRAAKRAQQKQPMPGLPARPPIPPVKPASSAN